MPPSTFATISIASLALDQPLGPTSDFQSALYGCLDEPHLASIDFDAGLTQDTLFWGFRALAVTGDWDIQPRPVQAVGLDAPEYQESGESHVPPSAYRSEPRCHRSREEPDWYAGQSSRCSTRSSTSPTEWRDRGPGDSAGRRPIPRTPPVGGRAGARRARDRGRELDLT
jgi:hypothetical protein